MKIRIAKVIDLVKLDVDKNNDAYVAIVFKWKGGSYLRNFNVRDKNDAARILKLMEWAGTTHLAGLKGKRFSLLGTTRANWGIGQNAEYCPVTELQYIAEIPDYLCMREHEILKALKIG